MTKYDPKTIRCGLKFNKLRFHQRINNTTGIFECDCGTQKQLRIADFISGRKKSCGCLHKKMIAIGISKTVKLEKYLKETNYNWRTFKPKNHETTTTRPTSPKEIHC